MKLAGHEVQLGDQVNGVAERESADVGCSRQCPRVRRAF